MGLARYRAKRDFRITSEPAGRAAAQAGEHLRYVIQKHDARRLHYDFRLELDGVLLSWAIPKGPSLDPAVKRLAVHVEDHPVDYGNFEGVIPERQYGAGAVIVWDRGEWEPIGDAQAGYKKGHLRFRLEGERLSGEWALVRMHGRGGDEDKDNWLLVKADDEAARSGKAGEITAQQEESVLSGRSVEAVAKLGADTPATKASKPAQEARQAKAEQGKEKRGKEKQAKEKQTQEASDEPTLATRKRRSAESTAVASRATRTKAKAGTARGAHASPSVPSIVSPQLATLATRAPEAEADWLAEIKFDGYRILAHVAEQGTVRLYSRNGKDWTARMPDITAAIAGLPLSQTWFDGEVVALDARGQVSFQSLQNAFSGEIETPLWYYVFDLPYAEGEDLRDKGLIDRKARLESLLAQRESLEESPLRYSEHLTGRLGRAFEHACHHGLEGVVLKRADSPYRDGQRSPDWLKLKCSQQQEFVIGGFTDPAGSRSGFGALLLGYYDDAGGLRYAGRVGTGFDESMLQKMTRMLRALERKTSPFANPPQGREARGAHWVKPDKVAEVRFAEWTSEGVLRQAAFLGLREDKPARAIVREKVAPAGAESTPAGKKTAAARKTRESSGNIQGKSAAATVGSGRVDQDADQGTERIERRPQTPTATVAGVKISHASRVLYPESGYTKRDLAEYYERHAGLILPQLDDRPLSLVRCPDGADSQCFFQKHRMAALPESVKRVSIPEDGGAAEYMEVDSVAALVSLVQFGVMEMHTWGSRTDALDKPDRLIFDLDPAEDVSWAKVVEGAQVMRGLLDELGLRSFLKTSGGKGLHVEVPIQRSLDWTTAKDFAHAIADHMAKALPKHFLATATKAQRKGRIFVDYLRNARGATAIAAYCTRARAGAPIAMPITWEQLPEIESASQFRLDNVDAWLAQRGEDPWKDYWKLRQRIGRSLLERFGITAVA